MEHGPRVEALVLNEAVAGSISGLVTFPACLPPSLITHFPVNSLSYKGHQRQQNLKNIYYFQSEIAKKKKIHLLNFFFILSLLGVKCCWFYRHEKEIRAKIVKRVQLKMERTAISKVQSLISV